MSQIIIKNVNVSNVAQAIRGMRNHLENWAKSDSKVFYIVRPMHSDAYYLTLPLHEYDTSKGIAIEFTLGEKDKELAFDLIKAGPGHSVFMRQIFICADITAPMTWWIAMDAFMAGAVRNFTVQMHKLVSRPLTKADFAWDETDEETETMRGVLINSLNGRVKEWKEAIDSRLDNPEILRAMWRRITDDIPLSYLNMATWSANYQILRDIYFSQEEQSQTEFGMFRDFIETLPYSELITCSRR